MLNIKTINYVAPYKDFLKKNLCKSCVNNIQLKTAFSINTLTSDTFNFSGNKISFGALPANHPSGEDFLEKFKQSALSEEDFIRLARNSGKFLGDSYTVRVFTIPVDGMEKYCIKIPKYNGNGKQVEVIKDIFPGENYGQAVAKIGNCQVLLKVEGKACGIPQWNETLSRAGIEKIYGDYLVEAAAMPQKAYDDLAKKLHKVRYRFDAHSNNILMDLKKKKFNMVDVDTKEIDPPASFHEMTRALVDSYRIHKYGLNDESFVKQRKIILEKCIQASLNTGCLYPHNDKEPYNIDVTFEMCGMKGKWGNVRDRLNKAKK